MTTADKPGPFDKACDILQWAMNHETATHEQIESIKAVLAVLEAAAKVDGPATLKDLSGYWSFLAIHGFTQEDPLVVAMEALLAALPARSSEASGE